MHQLIVPRGRFSQRRIRRTADDGPFDDGVAEQFADDPIDVGLFRCTQLILWPKGPQN